MKSLVIIGAGGHGLVVAEAAAAMATWQTIYFLDKQYSEPTVVNNIQVLSHEQFQMLSLENTEIVVAIGDNSRRYELTKLYLDQGYTCPVIIHPTACTSPSASIGAGTVILANAVINAKAILGIACIVNTAAVIEHQCVLGVAVHISPQACLAGNVSVGSKSWIGAGAIVINNKHLANDVIVGAGAVVVNDISSKQCVVGVPAKPLLQEV
jgi:sugar O-acyltransferase (sialic acid O-acetyltransferase NeuD family)